jgi:hypothetical protein
VWTHIRRYSTSASGTTKAVFNNRSPAEHERHSQLVSWPEPVIGCHSPFVQYDLPPPCAFGNVRLEMPDRPLFVMTSFDAGAL